MWDRLPKITRDLVLFATGLVLTINEAVWRDGPERPTFLVLYAGMMGLPAILQAEVFRKNGTNGSSSKPKPKAKPKAKAKAKRR